MDWISNILLHWQSAAAVLLVLGGLIFFHELGHFTVARLFGIGVRTFSLGFGPKLIRRRYGKTDYCLSLVPLGGYVSLVGEEGDPGDEQQDDPEPGLFTEQEEFFRRPALQRLLVVLAGPVANFVLAFFLYWGIAWAAGQTYLLPVIAKVAPDSPAAAAGIKPGDTVRNIDGTQITRWEQISEAVSGAAGKTVRVTVARGEEGRETLFSMDVTPRSQKIKNLFGEEKSAWLIGIEVGHKTGSVPLNGFQALGAGLEKTGQMIAFTVESLVKLVQRVVPLESVGGPILIAQAVGKQAQESLTGVLLLAALISVNLGILNLLPIPVLDGGHIAFYGLEMLLGRPVRASIRMISVKVGMALLLLLMVFATWNDLVRLFS